GFDTRVIVARVEMDPLERRVTKQVRGTHRIGDDQRDLLPETTVNHVLVQSARESSATVRNRQRVIILPARAFRTTPTTGVDSNHADVLAAALNNFSKRTKTPAQVCTHLNKPAPFSKRIHGLFLCGAPRKPTINVVPVTTTAKAMEQ